MSTGSTLSSRLLCGCIFAALLALGACADSDPTPIVPDNSTASGSLNLAPTNGGKGGKSSGTSAADYRLGPNDRTRIIVFGQPNLTGEFQLDGNGVLAFPLIGNVDANGMTPRDLQRAIANKLDPEYMHNPSVSVEVATRRPFYVVGEVQRPGSYPYVTDMTLLEAVATAGGETYRANMSKFWIKRRVNGEIVRVAGSQESQIQPGDTVIVRERYF
ncbi:polysaccharide export outer membrane protein [Enhydrobacter aerosaccus]|uniref:Polysaccharide export outer membrane protein n=1 Tax=Enhydrobacter aerosaccus TaxID=225324 RepID=A0A1T4SRD5_9HYPH|nr:polysaccharide biosynthesis/export family protein [Enhydrobacter aerosaccus]SKA30451.1 polysaccharide export outer membrane protein [Enhydrobacter aerosaccus]